MKLDADEKELLESVEGGEWTPAGGGKRCLGRPHRILHPGERRRPGLLEPVHGPALQLLGACVQVSLYSSCDFLVVGCHSRTPWAESISANAWTAREQCVFTLPSEQPIAAAVSATSSSSQ